MKMPPDEQPSTKELRDKIIGLGEKSFRKSYYPELQKKLEDLERYKTLLDQSNDAIFLVKVPSGQFLSVSESAYRQPGFSGGELRTIYDLLPDNRGDLDEIFSGRTESTVFDARLVKRDGEETFYEVNMHRVRMGHHVYVVAVARNVTERKRVEIELKRSEERLRLKLDSVLSPDVDLSEQELSSIIDTRALQRLMDDFYKVTRMGVGIIDLRGNVLVGTGWQEACTQYHRKCPLSLMNCLESDLQLTRDVKKGEFKAYKCKNNMWDLVTPLYIGEKHVGNIFLGQFFYDDEVPDRAVFEAQAERFGYDRDLYLAAIEKIPRWSREKVENMIRFYARLADMISSLSFANVKLARAMAEERLTEDRMRVFFERQLVGMAITSPERGWLQVNDKVCQILGYSREELSTMTWAELTHPEDLSADVAQFNRLLAGEIDDYTIEKRYIRKDGSELPVIISNGCVRKADSSVDYVLTLIEDITERKRADDALRESEENLRLALEGAHMGIWNWNLVTGELVWSERCKEIFGLARDIAMSYEVFLHAVHPADRDRIDRAVRQALEQKTDFNTEMRVPWPDGSLHWVAYKGRGFYDADGQAVRMLGIALDITERKLAMEATVEAKAQAELYLDLMSHDITNMNHALLGYLELMAISSPGGTEESDMISRSLEIINRSSRIIGQVKKLTRLKAGMVPQKEVDVCKMLSEIKARYSEVPGRQVTISYTPGQECKVRAGELLTDALENLVDNAIRHSPGPVTVELAAERVRVEGHERLQITVADNGPGIPDKLKVKIFMSLEELEEKKTRRGFGLYFVRTVVDHYQGEVWVEDRMPGDYTKGSKFVVQLPASAGL